MPSTLHTYAAGGHEPTPERNTMKIKDRNRSTVHSVPYRKMPLLNIDSIVGQEKSMLDTFPYNTGISTTISARKIIKGRPNLYYNTMYLNMGAYVQIFEGKKNIPRSRLVGAVAFNSSNEKG